MTVEHGGVHEPSALLCHPKRRSFRLGLATEARKVGEIFPKITLLIVGEQRQRVSEESELAGW